MHTMMEGRRAPTPYAFLFGLESTSLTSVFMFKSARKYEKKRDVNVLNRVLSSRLLKENSIFWSKIMVITTKTEIYK